MRKPRQPSETSEIAPPHLGEQVDGVRRHADQEARPGFEDAVGEACAARQIVDDEFAAHRKRHHLRAEAEVVAERAERKHHGRVVDVPVLGELARVGEQRVVGVHHALRLARRAGGEGEIDDAVGVGFQRRAQAALSPMPANGVGVARRARLQPVDVLERRTRPSARRSNRACPRRRRSRPARSARPRWSAAAVRRPRQPCGRDAATGSRSCRRASRRAAPPRSRSGSAATPRRAGPARRRAAPNPPPAHRRRRQAGDR